MLERVARDEVIRGYFSDEAQDNDLAYSCLREDIAEALDRSDFN